jgi:hypothetical protein
MSSYIEDQQSFRDSSTTLDAYKTLDLSNQESKVHAHLSLEGEVEVATNSTTISSKAG